MVNKLLILLPPKDHHIILKLVLFQRFTFALRKSARSPFGGPHVHTFEISANQIQAMREGVGNPGYLVQVSTSEMSRHSHNLQIRMRNCKLQKFQCTTC